MENLGADEHKTYRNVLWESDVYQYRNPYDDKGLEGWQATVHEEIDPDTGRVIKVMSMESCVSAEVENAPRRTIKKRLKR